MDTQVMTTEDLVAAGDPQAALDALQRQVREHAADQRLRVFLFQLLCAAEAPAAAELRSRAFDAAPATPGWLDDEAFEWIVDADSRLGPVLEAVLDGRYCWVPFAALVRVRIEPVADLRDLVWAPAQLQFVNGGESVALLPSRYVRSAESGDGALQLVRRDDWLELGGEQYRGIGQRVLATSSSERGLLDVRDIVFDATCAG